MARQIWKYPIPMAKDFTIQMPMGSVPLHVTNQHGIPTLWASVNPKASSETRRFQLYGTGQDLDPLFLEYVGTVLLAQGFEVYHLFEVNGPVADE